MGVFVFFITLDKKLTNSVCPEKYVDGVTFMKIVTGKVSGLF